jgi:NADH dehydrogenase FAD-containing subunit
VVDRLGAVVTALGRKAVMLANGEAITADAVVLTTGMRAAGFTEEASTSER